MLTNLRVRASLITAIYEKALLIRSSSLSKFSTGKVCDFPSFFIYLSSEINFFKIGCADPSQTYSCFMP